ncbi:Hypothetical protein FKW44_006346 [Caligus rogercresseyi]|uniref:Uncharacterized protein n=1 Tax=Caligus rogercresseyi TaxID=217165 RepID=A0A7T8KD74_CALRO|nr:Hypothetical protein FKW44_006346 [Caligus rogercresseyi]
MRHIPLNSTSGMESYPSSSSVKGVPSLIFVRELPVPRLRTRRLFLRLQHRAPRPSSS